MVLTVVPPPRQMVLMVVPPQLPPRQMVQLGRHRNEERHRDWREPMPMLPLQHHLVAYVRRRANMQTYA